jgi:transcriptional regulator with XRE-family HTH domain
MSTRPTEGTAVQKSLGDAFRAVRTNSGFSLKALAQRMRRSINTIRWHEAGSRSLRADDLVLAAQVMGCSPTKLMQEKPPVLLIAYLDEGGDHDAAATP